MADVYMKHGELPSSLLWHYVRYTNALLYLYKKKKKKKKKTPTDQATPYQCLKENTKWLHPLR